MLVRQAIVCSPISRALKANEVVAKSANIDDQLALKLCQWSPGRTGFGYGQTQSINFFQPDSNTFAISRCVGSLDTHREAGRRVVSQIILFDREQLSGYDNNVAHLAHVVRSEGKLVLESNPNKDLPLVKIPDRGLAELGAFEASEFSGDFGRVSHAVELHQRVVVLGLKNPLWFLCSFLAQMPESKRLDFSFSTGLKVEDDRPFTLQFFPESERDMVNELASRQIRTISLDAPTLVRY